MHDIKSYSSHHIGSENFQASISLLEYLKEFSGIKLKEMETISMRNEGRVE